MKRITVILFSLISFACSKDTASSGAASGSWKVDRTGNLAYAQTIRVASRQNINGFKVLDLRDEPLSADGLTFQLWFKEWPTTSGLYTTREFMRSPQTLGDNEVGITMRFPGKDTLYSTGLAYVGVSPQPADKVSITVSGSKMNIVVPRMSAYTSTSRYTDSASFEAHINEE